MLKYIPEEEKKFIYAFIRSWFKRSKIVLDNKNEFRELCYIVLLEYKQNNQDIQIFNNEELMKLFNKTIEKQIINKQKEVEFYSIHKAVKSTKEGEELTLENCLEDKEQYFDSFDYYFLLSKMFELLENYTNENKDILINYFFNKTEKIRKFCEKNNTTRTDVKELVREFRQKYKILLLESGYINIDKFKSAYIEEAFDEFSGTSSKSINEKNRRERIKAKKQGAELNNYANDFKIYQLIRQDNNINECASILNIPTEKLNAIVTHKNGSFILRLYQIQALRQKFYNTYSLEDLVKC